MRVHRLLGCLAVGLFCASSWAQTPEAGGTQDLDISKIMASMGGSMAMAAEGGGNKLPDFDKVTKDMVKKEGLFTLWSYPPGTKDEDPEKLLCQIPSSFLGEKFMLSTSFSGGGFMTGFPLDERVVKWELKDKQLLLVEPQAGYVINKGKDVADVVRRTYPDRIRTSVKLVTKAPNGDPVIDFGALLKSDFADIGWMSGGGGGPFGGLGGGGSISQALSQWVKTKSFPLNVEVGVALAVSRRSPPGSYDKKMIHYSFWKLPASDYKPRVADDRVGYFMTTNQDWSRARDARDVFNRYVDRWHLVKRDPSLKLCEPKHPIVYYIEKTVPVKYRRAVRDGILAWNEAYEEIGFLNAVEVRQQTNDNEWKDLDPEDMRYSFFRWIVTGAGFAMGPHRANPFTGQIYDADIVFDDSMVRIYEQRAIQQLPSALAQARLNDPALRSFLAEYPQWNRPTRDWEGVDLTDPEAASVKEAMQQRMGHEGVHSCQYAEGMKHQLAFAHTMLAGQPREVIDDLLYDIVKEVVMHEVGHTLGLRHNFKASSVWTVEEIKERRKEGQPTTASVMDYNPILFFAEGATDGDYITPTIGPYDHWAIEYGYRPFDGKFQAKDDEEDDDADEPNEVESASASGVTSMEMPANFDMSQIPAEILAQMPPEVKEMIASGKVQKMMQHSAPSMPGMAASHKGSGGPSFTSAPSGEEGMLKAIAARSAEPELVYATDEDTTFLGPDPRVNRFDMSADSIEWAKSRAELVEKRMADILDWSVKDEESWYHLRSAYGALMFEKARQVAFVGRFIGGQYFNRSHRGDKESKPPFEVVDVNTQRDAMAFIEDSLFQDKFFETSSEVLNHLAPSRWWHQGSSISFTMDYPIHDMVATMQWWTLFDRLFPNTLRRIHDAELKANGSDKFTVAEYLQRMSKACWADATNAKRAKSGTWTDNKPYLSDIRRSLQREYLGLLEPLVRQEPGRVISPDLHAMVQYSLKLLSDDLDEVIKASKVDFASGAHLVACKSRIDRMLSADLEEHRPQPMFMMFGKEAQTNK